MKTDAPTTTTMTVDHVMKHWLPDKHGKPAEWTWEDAAAHALLHETTTTFAVLVRIREEGIGFADGHSPILLGTNVHVWDGHHRLILARALGIMHVEVELA